MRTALSHKHIRGHGVEIGGLHVPTIVLPGAVVDYVDMAPFEELKRIWPDVKPVQNPIIVDDAETLATLGNGIYDFVVANHVLEHCHDPIGTLKNWARVVRSGGILYVALPEKTKTFDAPRKITTMDHLILDYLEGPEKRDREHYREWIYEIDKLRGDELDRRVEEAISVRANIHFHCFTLQSMTEFMNLPIVSEFCQVVERVENGAEVIWILRRK